MPQSLEGLNGLAGITALSEQDPFASAEDRMGGPANPKHREWGEQAKPYSWESQQTMAGSRGPFGTENQLLDDEYWFYEPAGSPVDDPQFDNVMPSLTRSHGAPHHVTLSGPASSQYDAINGQLAQSVESHAIETGSSRQMLTDQQGYAQQDQWQEIWQVNAGNEETARAGISISMQANGFGANDRISNAGAKRNDFGYDSAHLHRRFATGHIPYNYMWMRPGGRPMYKTLAGPARPAIGANSPFEGDDIGAAFGIQGAILQNTPQEYTPPPQPNYANSVMQPVNPYGTDSIDMW